MIVFAMLVGGGTQQGLWSDHLLQILLLPALYVGLIGVTKSRFSGITKGLVAAILVVILVQFLPVLRSAELPGILPSSGGWSFFTPVPQRSLESALFALTIIGFALFLSRFSERELERLLPFLFVGFVLNVIAGLVQLSSPQLPDTLDVLPYIPSIGLMANENHASSLAYIMLPLLAFRYVVRDGRVWIYIALSAAIVFYLFAVGSRAGMALSSAVAVLSLAWFKTERLALMPRISLFGAGLCALLLISALFGFDDSNATDIRPVIFATSWKAIQTYWLTGAGLGAFPYVYPSFETLEDVLPAYINHAHNDYLEIFLEVGIVGVLIVGLFFGLIARSFRRSLLAEAAALSILALAIHSLVDYPLRTMAISVLFAYFVAVILSTNPDNTESSRERGRRPSRSGQRRRRPRTTRDGPSPEASAGN